MMQGQPSTDLSRLQERGWLGSQQTPKPKPWGMDAPQGRSPLCAYFHCWDRSGMLNMRHTSYQVTDTSASIPPKSTVGRFAPRAPDNTRGKHLSSWSPSCCQTQPEDWGRAEMRGKWDARKACISPNTGCGPAPFTHTTAAPLLLSHCPSKEA